MSALDTGVPARELRNVTENVLTKVALLILLHLRENMF